MGSSGTASPIIQAGYSRCALHVGWVHPPLVVETWLLLAGQWEGFTQASQLQEWAVTTNHQPTPSMEGRLYRGRLVVLRRGL